MDPKTGLTAASFALKALRHFAESSEVDRLFELLDKRFGDETGLTYTQLDTWRSSDDFMATLFSLAQTGDWPAHRQALADAILGLTAAEPKAPSAAETGLAGELVMAIEELLPAALQGDQVTRYEGALTRAELGATGVRYVSLEWVPDRAHDLVLELIEHNEKEGAALEDALAGGGLRAKVRGLVRQPPRWVREGSGWLWAALAGIAEGLGEWDVALTAWTSATDQAGGDRVVALTRAATAAAVLGQDDRWQELRDAAIAAEPDHPVVVLNEVQQEEDANLRLELLEAIEPRTERQRASRDAEYAAAYIDLEDFDLAEDHLDSARERYPKIARIRELGARLVSQKNLRAWRRGEPVDTPALLAAAEELVALRDEHRNLGVHAISVNYIAKAAGAYVRAERPDVAAELLDPNNLLEEELAVPQGREQLAEAAVGAMRPDIALALLPEDAEDPVIRLLRAMALVDLGTNEGLTEGLPLLDKLVAGGDHRKPAALHRLVAAAEQGAPWSQEAENVLKEQDEVIAALLKARWLARDKDWVAAERELARHRNDPRVQQQLLRFASEEGDAEKVRVRAGDLLRRGADHSTRFDCARALRDIGDMDAANAEFERLKDDQTAPEPLRIRCHVELTNDALSADHHREVLRITDSWVALAPSDPRATWTYTHSLFRLGRFDDAATFMNERGMDAETLDEARLAGRIYGLTQPPREALDRILTLADAQPEPDADLEFLAIQAALRIKERLPDEIIERIRVDRFVERFPDSGLIQAIEVPETQEGIEAFFRELSGERGELTAKFEKQVLETGEAPTALLALAAGKAVGELWGRLQRLPLGFSQPELDDLELEDALGAVGFGAVWDPTSLFVVGLLGAEFTEEVRQALPKTVIAQSTVDDSIAGGVDLVGLQEERHEAGFDPASGPWVLEWTPEQIARDRERAERTLELAKSIDDVEPDAPEDDQSEQAEFLRGEERPRQIVTVMGTLAVAQRLGLPVFSDDRYVRVQARRLGLRAFGTIALLDAMEPRGYIDADRRANVRARLRHAGAQGTSPSAEELVAEGHKAEWSLTRGLAHALFDPGPWQAGAERQLHTYLAMLRGVFGERPDRFVEWVARTLDAMRTAVPQLKIETHARNLILLAWDLEHVQVGTEAEFLQSLVTAIENATPFVGPVGDPVLAAMREVMEVTENAPYPVAVKLHIVRLAIDQLPPKHRWRLRPLVFLGADRARPLYGEGDVPGL